MDGIDIVGDRDRCTAIKTIITTKIDLVDREGSGRPEVRLAGYLLDVGFGVGFGLCFFLLVACLLRKQFLQKCAEEIIGEIILEAFFVGIGTGVVGVHFARCGISRIRDDGMVCLEGVPFRELSLIRNNVKAIVPAADSYKFCPVNSVIVQEAAHFRIA